jgi:hypothetical protein
MNDLQQVVADVKAALEKKFVFVHMKAPQLETLLAGLEEQQKRVGQLEGYMELIIRTTVRPQGGEAFSLSGHMNAVEYAKHVMKEPAYENR